MRVCCEKENTAVKNLMKSLVGGGGDKTLPSLLALALISPNVHKGRQGRDPEK